MLLTDLIRTIIFFIVTINPFSQCVCKFLEFYLFDDTEIWGPNFVSKWVFGFLRTLG